MTATSPQPSRREALNRLALRLAETGSAEAPRDELDDLQPAVNDLLKAGALIEISGQIRFAHESLRDFVYAEAFAGIGSLIAPVPPRKWSGPFGPMAHPPGPRLPA